VVFTTAPPSIPYRRQPAELRCYRSDLHFAGLTCNPASPACCDPALPIHITSHRTESTGLSTTSSTSCPRLSLKSPRNLNPSCDLSTTRQGTIRRTPSRLMTSLAGFLVAIRLERRLPGIGELGTCLAPVLGVSFPTKIKRLPAFASICRHILCSRESVPTKHPARHLFKTGAGLNAEKRDVM
jgi:hypothetical protein